MTSFWYGGLLDAPLGVFDSMCTGVLASMHMQVSLRSLLLLLFYSLQLNLQLVLPVGAVQGFVLEFILNSSYRSTTARAASQ
jgi:hypothetical protein